MNTLYKLAKLVLPKPEFTSNGAFRNVFIYKDVVIKLPRSIDGWYSNWTEIKEYKKSLGKDYNKYLAPVLLHCPLGIWVMMQRAEVAGNDYNSDYGGYYYNYGEYYYYEDERIPLGEWKTGAYRHRERRYRPSGCQFEVDFSYLLPSQIAGDNHGGNIGWIDGNPVKLDYGDYSSRLWSKMRAPKWWLFRKLPILRKWEEEYYTWLRDKQFRYRMWKYNKLNRIVRDNKIALKLFWKVLKGEMVNGRI